MRQFRQLFRFAARRLNEEHLPQVAGSLTFTTMLALVPLLTIALAIFATFPLFSDFRTSLEVYVLQSLIPGPIATTIIDNLNTFSSKATRLSTVGAIFLLGAAVSMLAMIERTFNQIWRVREGRSPSQRLLMYWSLITLWPLLVGGSISMTSSFLGDPTDFFKRFELLGTVLYTLSSLVLTTLAFALLYVTVPNRAVAWRDAIWGGLVAALAFELLKVLFVEFITQFPTYTVVYGALAALPIFLLWVYSCWLITLFGAVLVAALPTVKYERWWYVRQPGSDFIDAMTILGILHEAKEGPGSSAVDMHAFRKPARIGFDEAERLLQRMQESGWVARLKPEAGKRRALGMRVADAGDTWVLLANTEQLKLSDVYRLFVFDAHERGGLTQHVDRAIEQGMNVSLSEYFEKAHKQGPVAAVAEH
jgi:membrane protein